MFLSRLSPKGKRLHFSFVSSFLSTSSSTSPAGQRPSPTLRSPAGQRPTPTRSPTGQRPSPNRSPAGQRPSLNRSPAGQRIYDHLRLSTDRWQGGDVPSDASLRDPADPLWGLEARGVEILPSKSKGSGIFATRKFSEGEVMGIYHGEQMNLHDFTQWQSDGLDSMKAGQEKWAGWRFMMEILPLEELLDEDADEEVFMENAEYLTEVNELTVVIDAADPSKSSWARLINHAPGSKANCELRVDMFRPLVWFETSKTVRIGDEILFDYGHGKKQVFDDDDVFAEERGLIPKKEKTKKTKSKNKT